MVSGFVVDLLTVDIFSALDALTSRYIIDNLFNGELMRGRTVLLIVSYEGVALSDGRRTMSASPLQCRTT